MLIIGTNAEVYPAAGIPPEAKKNGATIIEINICETHFTREITDIFICEKAVAAMEKIGELLYL